MSRWKILAATTALAAMMIAPTVSLPVCARELQPLATATPEQVGMSLERLGRITSVLKKEIADGKLPGAVVMVARKGKIVYSDAIGFQDKGANTPMKLDSIFRIYSMTKPLVSVAAMMLVEDGVIQLTDPISKFLPAFKDMQVSVATPSPDGKATYTNVPASRPIIVQDLLRHSAGLAYAEITKNEPVKAAYVEATFYQPGIIEYDSRGMTPAEQVERIAKAPLIHQPGTMWEYSMAVDILGRVVEAASGKRLAIFLDERLFKPLKMVDSGFWVPSSTISRLAQPLPVDPASGLKTSVLDVSAEPKNDSGGAGAVSTATDYLRFGQMLLNGGELDGVRVLGRSTIKLMTSDHLGTRVAAPLQPGELLLGTPGYTFGLGFAVRQGDGVAGVPGSAGEFMWAGYAGTFFWVDPQEEIVGVYMTQAPSPIRAYYRKMFKALVYQALAD
ncbi:MULTISPECIES: serine hydrolase domain-containing protein [unclassified Bradyrhizobium]|uniref:serine hydrolase domain-containing protein n=1 Tax=unclassified Bradyrhizobium TaxID=2631580 RepID=UPI002FF2B9A8